MNAVREIHESFEPDSTAAARGRALVAQALRSWGCDELVEDAILVTSELVANAVAHTGEPFEVRLVMAPHAVRVEVTDQSRRPPRLEETGPFVPGGLGLVIVESVARSWGHDLQPDGKRVWAELAV